MDKRKLKKINLPVRYCIICNKPIIRNTKQGEKRINTTQYKKAKFCSTKCGGIWASINKTGKDNSNYRGGNSKCLDCGKPLPHRYSWRNITRCRKCWKIFLKNPSNHPNWKGGISSLSESIRILPQSKQWRLSVFKRDNYSCQKCSDNKGGNLEAHHKKSFALILKENKIKTLEQALNCKELWNISNGQTLCKNCHQLTDSFGKNCI